MFDIRRIVFCEIGDKEKIIQVMSDKRSMEREEASSSDNDGSTDEPRIKKVRFDDEFYNSDEETYTENEGEEEEEVDEIESLRDEEMEDGGDSNEGLGHQSCSTGNFTTGSEFYLCLFCGEKFLSKQELINHQCPGKAHKHQMGKFVRSIPPVPEFDTKKGGKTESGWRRHPNPSKLTFRCEKCGKSFRSAGNLKIHLRVHSEKKKFKCGVCRKKFKMEKNLRIHMEKHVDEEGQCTFCGHRLRVLPVPTPNASFQCPRCDQSFKSFPELVAHIKSAHPDYQI